MQNRPNEVFARHGIDGVLNLDAAEAEMDVDNIPRIAMATPDGRIVGVGVAQAILIAVELAKDYPNEADRLKLLIEVARRL